MKCYLFCAIFLILFSVYKSSFSYAVFKKPTITIGILVRNKAHILPYTLSFLEKLNYPKDRIALWIQCDNNIDDSIKVLETWLDEQNENYFSVNVTLDKKTHGHEDEQGIADWTPMRFENIINLREKILTHARKIWSDYLFMLDADVLLTNPNVLDLLISKNETIVSPLLKSDGMYSNFWAGMTEDYYYERTDEYEPILHKKKIGCFSVPMVHSALLIDLRRKISDFLTYDSKNLGSYDGPRDDIITFALGAKIFGIEMNICNDEIYGFLSVPLEKYDSIEYDYQQLINLKLEILADRESIPLSKTMKNFVSYPNKTSIGVSNVYMINLLRRPERRQRMIANFDELGIDAEIIDAVDGRNLDKNVLDEWRIKMMPGYKDPYHKRPMTMGEVGCFLSHYIAWNNVIEANYENALILEDDVKFEPYFKQKLNYILKELENFRKDWDLVYLGRKRMEKDPEEWVQGSKYLVYAGYSYWTVGYLISLKGAKKLVDARPLENLIPVDEFLPIMYDRHSRDDWKIYFENRSLIALSAEPLILFPTHYTGDNGYVSDTENSVLLSNESSGDLKEEL